MNPMRRKAGAVPAHSAHHFCPEARGLGSFSDPKHEVPAQCRLQDPPGSRFLMLMKSWGFLSPFTTVVFFLQTPKELHSGI